MLLFLVLGLPLCFAAIFMFKYLIASRGLSETALQEYKYRSTKGYDFKGASQDAFVRAYCRVYGPRSSLYVAGTFLAVGLLTLPWLKILELVYEYGWRWGGQDRVYEPGYLVWQFMLFGGVITGWALLMFLGARFYHRSAPESLMAEIEKEKNSGN